MKESKELSTAFHEGTSRLYKKYHPMEVDLALPLSERSSAMEQWWSYAHHLLLAERVTRRTFADMIAREASQHALYFRDGTQELVDRCRELGVPLLIFSAGLGDLIDAAIAPLSGWGDVHVISNHLQFDVDTGVATGFRHKNVHTFSKNEVVLRDLHERWGSDVIARPNVVLLGDSVGDAGMAAGVAHECVFKIGFLNHENSAALEDYLEAFDVVLVEDNTMDYVRELLQSL